MLPSSLMLGVGLSMAATPPADALEDPAPLPQVAETNTGATGSFFTTGDGVRIAFRVDGPPDAPALVLSNSIGTTLHMWDEQVTALSRHFRVVRYDMRGHGASGVPEGAYSVDRLGRDAIELLDALDIERTHFLGLSLGGYVGQWLGIHAPERIDRLILSNTASHLGPAANWDDAIAATRRATDMTGIAEGFLRNWFPPQMLEQQDPDVAPFRAMLLSTDRQGLAGSYAVVRDADMRRTVALIPRPTLVIAGEHDTVTTAAHGEALARAIPGAELRIMPTAHLPNVETPGPYLEAVLDFLLMRR